jgi:hypothetical protein
MSMTASTVVILLPHQFASALQCAMNSSVDVVSMPVRSAAITGVSVPMVTIKIDASWIFIPRSQ